MFFSIMDSGIGVEERVHIAVADKLLLCGQ